MSNKTYSDEALERLPEFLALCGIKINRIQNPKYLHKGTCPFCRGSNFYINAQGYWYCKVNNCQWSNDTNEWQNNLTGLLQKTQETSKGTMPSFKEAQRMMANFAADKTPARPSDSTPNVVSAPKPIQDSKSPVKASNVEFSKTIKYNQSHADKLNAGIESGIYKFSDQLIASAMQHGFAYEGGKFIYVGELAEVPF